MVTIIRFLIFLLLFSPFLLDAQTRFSGFVKDSETGELLIGATIVEDQTTNGTASNTNGYFSLIAKGNSISVSFIGYQTKHLKSDRDVVLIILLSPGTELDEINVTGQRFQKFNTTSLSVKQMLNIPAIGGKPDVMKTLQLMPGIQAQSEGTSLLNVRGGNPGENLYLIDNVPLLYVNHLGGFMSVFNPDMINSMEVYKGGFPAKYGGKLSSIMSITQREGNNKEWKGNLGIGVTDASFSVEGPMLRNRASIIVTGRKTLIDPLMILVSGLSGGGDYFVFYGFHDLNGKFTYRPDTKNSFHLNFYQGDDYLKYWAKKQKESGEKARMNNAWGNWMLSGRWSSVMNPRLFVNSILSFTNYRLKVVREFTSKAQASIDFKSRYLSKVSDVSFLNDWQYKVSKNYDLDFGLKLSSLRHIPNKIINSNSTIDEEYEVIQSFENAIYVNNQITILNFLDANVGLRGVSFINNDFSKLALEPRLSLTARLWRQQSLNFSYQHVNQFAHLLFTSGAIMNNEIWVPANDDLKPSQSVQYSLGWKGEYADGMFDSEVSVYYKKLNNLATYKEGYSNLLGDGGWRNKIESDGTGQSKGIEFLFRKNKGEWTGFVGYTYSETTRQFDGINRGEEYVFDYDRPHSFSFNVNKKLNEKWNANLVWVYQTGLPYTPVLGRQYVPVREGAYDEALIYGERNSARMKDYHRLDLGFSYEKTTKKGRRAIWTFSVYNAYSRSNPNAYYYDDNRSYKDIENGIYKPLKLYQISFFPIIPTVTYKVFFD